MGWSDLPQLLRLVAALAFVIALMGGFAFILKRLGLSASPAISSKNRRLKVIESLLLDNRRRAILIQRDNKQHLVILGPGSETVVETDIEEPQGNNDS